MAGSRRQAIDVLYCRSESQLGWHFEKTACLTAEQIKTRTRDSANALRNLSPVGSAIADWRASVSAAAPSEWASEWGLRRRDVRSDLAVARSRWRASVCRVTGGRRCRRAVDSTVSWHPRMRCSPWRAMHTIDRSADCSSHLRTGSLSDGSDRSSKASLPSEAVERTQSQLADKLCPQARLSHAAPGAAGAPAARSLARGCPRDGEPGGITRAEARSMSSPPRPAESPAQSGRSNIVIQLDHRQCQIN